MPSYLTRFYVLCLLSAETESGLIHFICTRESFRSFETRDILLAAWRCFSLVSALNQASRNTCIGIKKTQFGSDDMLFLDFPAFEIFFKDVERAGYFYIDPSNYFIQLLNMYGERHASYVIICRDSF